MTEIATRRWESKRTDETRKVEEVLRQAGFQQVDAYRYSPAVIRVRVIDRRFEAISPEDREAIVEEYLGELPQQTQADIVTLLTFTPSELRGDNKLSQAALLNREFEDPSPNEL